MKREENDIGEVTRSAVGGDHFRAMSKLIESKIIKEHIREKSMSSQPSAFQNQFSLQDISSDTFGDKGETQQ